MDPGSEWRLSRQWFLGSAMDELLGVDFAVAEKDRLYPCLDRILEHKQELFVWLKQKWADLFHSDFEVLLYDLTSTYFEGELTSDNPCLVTPEASSAGKGSSLATEHRGSRRARRPVSRAVRGRSSAGPR